VVAPAVAATSISGEREEGTFDLLLSTGLASRSIVFGKLVASIAFVLLVAMTALPGFAMAWMFGGVGVVDVVLTSVLLLAAVCLFSYIGVFCSALGRTSAVAALYAPAAAQPPGPARHQPRAFLRRSIRHRSRSPHSSQSRRYSTRSRSAGSSRPHRFKAPCCRMLSRAAV
jgi:hypothetical protein